MIVGGIVFRVVTPNHPGCPSLDAAGAPCIRSEFLANDSDPWVWTISRAEAHFFPTHLDAVIVAGKISKRCHATAEAPPGHVSIPERLGPRPELLPPPLPKPLRRSRNVRSRKPDQIAIDPFRAAQCRRDPVEAD